MTMSRHLSHGRCKYIYSSLQIVAEYEWDGWMVEFFSYTNSRRPCEVCRIFDRVGFTGEIKAVFGARNTR